MAINSDHLLDDTSPSLPSLASVPDSAGQGYAGLVWYRRGISGYNANTSKVAAKNFFHSVGNNGQYACKTELG